MSTFQAGDRVQLTGPKGRLNTITLVAGARFGTHKGDLMHDDIIGKPDLILNFAHFLRDHYQKKWKAQVAVFASSWVSLNGRPSREMIIPGTDLAKEERSMQPYKWIMYYGNSKDLSPFLSFW